MYLAIIKKMHIIFFPGVAKHQYAKDSIVFSFFYVVPSVGQMIKRITCSIKVNVL